MIDAPHQSTSLSIYERTPPERLPYDARLHRKSVQNIGVTERLACGLGGGALLTTGVWSVIRSRSWTGLAAGLGGLFLLYRAGTGRSRLYRAVHATDSPRLLSHPFSREIEVQETITINRTPADVYAFWRDFANLPRALRHVKHVQVLDEKRTRWQVRGPGGKTVEWTAHLTADVPNERLSWMTAESDTVDHRGSVYLAAAPGERGTLVRVSLIYRPRGGAVAALAAKLFGREPAQEIRSDLRRLKQFLETGEIATNAGPSGRTKSIAEEGVTQRSNRNAMPAGEGEHGAAPLQQAAGTSFSVGGSSS